MVYKDLPPGLKGGLVVSPVQLVICRRVTLHMACVQVPIFPPMQSLSDFDDAKCKWLIAAACGTAFPDVQVKSVKMWAMGAQVAQTFQACSSVLLLLPFTPIVSVCST